MAWTYSQLFNDLNDGDLNGQDSWSGHTDFDVQTSVKYEGAKAVSCAVQSKSISRSIDAISAGSFYVAMQITNFTTNNTSVGFNLYSGTTQICYCRLAHWGATYPANVMIYSDTGGPEVSVLSGCVAGQWYVVNLEFDDTNQDNKYRARAYDVTAATWGSFTDWKPTRAAYTTIDKIEFTHEYPTGYTFYFDTITPTDPTAPAGTKFQLNISDTWKTVSALQLNIGDVWKPVTKAFVNIGDVWKQIF